MSELSLNDHDYETATTAVAAATRRAYAEAERTHDGEQQSQAMRGEALLDSMQRTRSSLPSVAIDLTSEERTIVLQVLRTTTVEQGADGDYDMQAHQQQRDINDLTDRLTTLDVVKPLVMSDRERDLLVNALRREETKAADIEDRVHADGAEEWGGQWPTDPAATAHRARQANVMVTRIQQASSAPADIPLRLSVDDHALLVTALQDEGHPRLAAAVESAPPQQRPSRPNGRVSASASPVAASFAPQPRRASTVQGNVASRSSVPMMQRSSGFREGRY